MKKQFLIAVLLTGFVSSVSQAEDAFTGTKRAACEAILCLSTGSPPRECKDSLKKFFKIMVKSSLGLLNPVETLKARKNFLQMCPTADVSIIDQVNTSKNVKEYSDWDGNAEPLPKQHSQACIDYCQGHGECLAKASICN